MSSLPPERRLPRCPICGRPRHAKFKPFCSARCADTDLSRWLDGRYAIPAQSAEGEDSESAPRADGEES